MTPNLSSYPKGYALQKPEQSITPDQLRAVIARGGLTTRKYNGNRAEVLIDHKGDIRVFSRNGTLEWTGCVPALIEEVKALDLPPCSFLTTEIYVPATETTKAIQLVVASGNDVKGAQYEAQLQPNFAVIDILIWNGKDISAMAYEDRYALVTASFEENSRVHPVELVNIPSDYDEVMLLIQEMGCEGFVIADPKAAHKVNHSGNTKRGACWKLKIRHTEDMVATGFTLVKNAAMAALGVGSLKLSRKTPQGLIPMGKVGSFEVQFNRIAALTASYPMVVEVSHFGLDENGKLEFPKIVRDRPDLAPDMLTGLIPLGSIA